MKGIEPSSQPWQGRIITSILHLHGFSGARVGRALLYTTAPESGGDIQNRTEDERLQSSRFAIKLYRHMDQHKGFEPSPTEWKSVMLPLHQCWMYLEVAARNQHFNFL